MRNESEIQLKETLKSRQKVIQSNTAANSVTNEKRDADQSSFLQTKIQFRFLEEWVKPEPHVEGLFPELRQDQRKKKK